MKVADLVEAMEAIAPTKYAESWDNVGLLAGDPSRPIVRALLTIDYTAEVAGEGEAAGCDVVIAYHPPIFVPLKRLDGNSLIFDAIRRGVAIYSPHTALDAAEGGTNHTLCEMLELTDCRALEPAVGAAAEYKLVTFVPAEHLERVGAALFDAGAGKIGRYSSCSFRTEGTGTFFGEVGSNPAIGESGKLETSKEIRLETVVPVSKIAQTITALRAAHPYEEPAFDLLQLAAPPLGRGRGRVGRFAAPRDRGRVIADLKSNLGLEHLLVAGPTEGAAQRAAVCAGSCGDLLGRAIEEKVDVYLTGEMRHHDAIRAAASGITVVCTLHSNSERATLKRLKVRLAERLPKLELILSASDRDPFQIR